MTNKKKLTTSRVLSERALLISVEIKCWLAVKLDTFATEDVAESYETTSNWVKLSKRLIDPALLAECRKIKGQARNYLRGDSKGIVDGKFIPSGLPVWRGSRYILPSALNEQVLRNIGGFQNAFEEAVERLEKALPDAIETAKIQNPKLFNSFDYDSVENIIAKKFSFERVLDPIPEGGDVRIDAEEALVKEVRDEVEKKARKAQEGLAKHATDGLIKVARHLVKSCEDYDSENKGKAPFKDSSLNKARDLVPVIRALNINNDINIERAASDLLAAVGNK